MTQATRPVSNRAAITIQSLIPVSSVSQSPFLAKVFPQGHPLGNEGVAVKALLGVNDNLSEFLFK